MFYNKQIFERCFHYKGRYWYKNFKRIPLYFKLIHHLVKYGYDEYATWETFGWFTQTMKSVLAQYREYHVGTPILIDNYPMDSCDHSDKARSLRKQNEQMWDDIISRMIELLDLMDENNTLYHNEEYDYKRTQESMDNAKEEFFELFAKYFWCLWD